ncbi:Nuclear pore complex protein Nup54 [Ancistrocladus abbreviatus]
MFGSSPAFGTPSSIPAFGTPSSTPAFGTPSSTPAFGTPSSTPAFGFGATPSTPVFGATPSSMLAFGATPSSTPAFGATPTSTRAFGTPSSTPAFGTLSSMPAFGTPSTPSFATGLGSSLFSTPFSQTQQQQQTSIFQQPSIGGSFGFQTAPFATPQQQQTTPFANFQLTTQMAPVAPLPFSMAERDIQAIVEAYKDEPGNPKYAFKYLLFSVTEPQFRAKPAGVSDIMWAEAMGKLEGMDSSNRERLWPQLVQGFKDLSQRLKYHLSSLVIISALDSYYRFKDISRADTLPRIERLRQKEQGLQRRLLRVMRIIEALEGQGCRLPLMKGDVELAEKLAAITRQLKGSGADLSRRVQNLLTISRVQATANGGNASIYLPSTTKIHDRSLSDMQEVLQQQTEAIARLGNVLKRDIRDMEIIMAEDTER